MTRKRLTSSILTLLLVGLLATGVQAQDQNRAGTAGATFLLVPQTARTIGFGTGMTSGLNDMNGIEALYANPAGLTVNQGTSVLFSRVEYVADIGINVLGFAQRFGNNQLGLTLTAWDYGDIPVQTEQKPEITEETFSPSTIVLGLTYARQFTDRISAGVTVNGLSESIEDVRSNSIAFNAGMTYVVGETGLRFGVSLKNFGPQSQFSGNGLTRQVTLPEQRPDAGRQAVTLEASDYELPSMLSFGVSYNRDVGQGAAVTVLGHYRSNSYDEDNFSGGLELGFRNLVFVRGGYQLRATQDDSFFTGANFGAGLNLDLGGNRLSFDYAYRATDFFDAVNIFTASVTL